MRQRRSPQPTIRPGTAPGGKPQAGRRALERVHDSPGGRSQGQGPARRTTARPAGPIPADDPAERRTGRRAGGRDRPESGPGGDLQPPAARAGHGRSPRRTQRDPLRQGSRGDHAEPPGAVRWWGWIDPLRLHRAEEQLLLASLLDSPELGAFARVWAERAGRPVDWSVPVGDAPSWTARAGGPEAMDGRPAGQCRPVAAFPRLARGTRFPSRPARRRRKPAGSNSWRPCRCRPPCGSACEARRAAAPGRSPPTPIWGELREAGLKPWIHRRLTTAAKLPPDTDLTELASFQSGNLIVQDLSSQVVGLVCDPDPGERWWDVRGEVVNGLHALHLATIMGGKGNVVSTFEVERRRHDVALRLRATDLHNITTKVWDGQHPVGKTASFDGVLFDAPSSGIGTWRRHPDARWTITPTRSPNSRTGKSRHRGREHPSPAGRHLDLYGPNPDPGRDIRRGQRVPRRTPRFPPATVPSPLEEASTIGTLALWPQAYDCDARFIARMIRG